MQCVGRAFTTLKAGTGLGENKSPPVPRLTARCIPYGPKLAGRAALECQSEHRRPNMSLNPSARKLALKSAELGVRHEHAEVAA
jgi:hypothetical protein